MNIPNIPTDNLYKFIALVGTIIVLLTGYIAEKRVSEVGDMILELNEQISIYEVKKESHKIKANSIEKGKRLTNDVLSRHTLICLFFKYPGNSTS